MHLHPRANLRQLGVVLLSVLTFGCSEHESRPALISPTEAGPGTNEFGANIGEASVDESISSVPLPETVTPFVAEATAVVRLFLSAPPEKRNDFVLRPEETATSVDQDTWSRYQYLIDGGVEPTVDNSSEASGLLLLIYPRDAMPRKKADLDPKLGEVVGDQLAQKLRKVSVVDAAGMIVLPIRRGGEQLLLDWGTLRQTAGNDLSLFLGYPKEGTTFLLRANVKAAIFGSAPDTSGVLISSISGPADEGILFSVPNSSPLKTELRDALGFGGESSIATVSLAWKRNEQEDGPPFQLVVEKLVSWELLGAGGANVLDLQVEDVIARE